MFHKEHSIRGSKGKAVDVPLRKSDRRKLLDRAKQYFQPTLQNTDDANASILDKVLETTIMQGNISSRSIPMQGGKAWNMILYLKTPSSDQDASNDQPWPYSTSPQFVWMAMEEKSKVVQEVPCVPLWAVISSRIPLETLEPYVVQVPWQVTKFVCRGADLMRAGIRKVPSTPRSMVAVVAQGNPQPFAVGVLDTNKDAAFGVGTKGVGVQVWSAYGDDMWRFSMSTKEYTLGKDHLNVNVGNLPFDNGHYGNVGFQDGKLVLPLEAGESSDEEEDEAEGEAVAAGDESPGPSPASESDADQTKGDDTQPETKETALTEDSKPVEPAESAELTPEDILHISVCTALVSLKNKDFPLLLSTFYSQHVLEHCPPGTTIEIKQTKYKKFGAYIQEQVKEGLLQVGPDKSNPKNKDPQAMLNGYNKKHPDLIGIKAAPSTKSSSAVEKQVLVNLYMFHKQWSDLMRLSNDDVKAMNATSEERRGTGMLTTTEVRKVLEAYIQREELIVSGRPDLINMDGPLTQILFKKQSDVPDKLSRKDLVQRFQDGLLSAYALVKMPGSKIVKLAKGKPPKIDICVARRQSKKFVTWVRGLEVYDVDPQYFAKDVSKRLACSVSIDEVASEGRPALEKNRVELVFQGNIADELQALLVDETLCSHGGVKGSEYSVPKQVVEITLRKGVPPRKNKGK